MIKSNFHKICYNIYLFDKVFITMQIYINILNILNLIIFYNFTKVQLTYIILINKEFTKIIFNILCVTSFKLH